MRPGCFGIIGIALLGVIIGALCFSTPATIAQDAQPAKKIKIGVSIPAADHGWTAGIGWGAKRAMAVHPESEWSYSPASTPEKQIADIEDMMTKGVDGVVILATESAPLTPVAKQAHE